MKPLSCKLALWLIYEEHNRTSRNTHLSFQGHRWL